MSFDLKDIVTLAKAGYKVSEVKELIALAKSDETKPEKEDENKDQAKSDETKPEKEDENKDQAKKTEQHDGGKEPPQEAQKNATDTSKEDSVILSYKQKVEELQQQVKDLQERNIHKDNSDVKTKSDEELLNDLTASFM